MKLNSIIIIQVNNNDILIYEFITKVFKTSKLLIRMNCKTTETLHSYLRVLNNQIFVLFTKVNSGQIRWKITLIWCIKTKH